MPDDTGVVGRDAYEPYALVLNGYLLNNASFNPPLDFWSTDIGEYISFSRHALVNDRPHIFGGWSTVQVIRNSRRIIFLILC